MARVVVDLPRPTTTVTVDPKELLSAEDEDAVRGFDPDTGLPKSLRAFVVLKDPKMTVVPHFFSAPECEHLRRLVDGYWMPSLVGQATYSTDEQYDKGDLENALSTTRTSWSCMLRYAQTDVVERLEHRLAALAGLPREQLERMNMVRYAPGELFDEHHDGKFRPTTIFVYLNDLPEDDDKGDTFFPHMGLSFKPRQGTAVMWSNIDPASQQEDSRMLHSGRAPAKGIKYGVNCFFNVRDMRQLIQCGPEIPAEQAAVVNVAELGERSGESGSGNAGEVGSSSSSSKGARLVAYRLCLDPKLVALPAFLSEAEAEHLQGLLGTAGDATSASSALFRGGTETLRSLEAAETSLVQAVEERLAATAGLGLEYLGRLRIVRPGTQLGLCNRGCGPKSVYMCLSERDEVFFPRLGMRLVMRRGDLLMWPNVDWETGQAVEDVRTLRVHLPAGPEGVHSGVEALGVDAFFHDNPVRAQQQLRQFVPDGALGTGAGEGRQE